MPTFSVISEPQNALVGANAAVIREDGKLLLLRPSAKDCQLLVSKEDYPATIEDFEPLLTLFGESGILEKITAKGAGIVIAGNRLLVVWSAENRLNFAAASLCENDYAEWEKDSCQFEGEITVEQILTDGQGRAYILYHEKTKNPVRFSFGMAVWDGSSINPRTFVESDDALYSPRGTFNKNGNIEVVWMASELDPHVMYTLLDTNGECSSAVRLHEGVNPDIFCEKDRTFIVCEQLDGNLRVDIREGGHITDILVLNGRMRYRPALEVDEHGVVWLFAVDADQRGLFYRRFLGKEFSFEAQCGGAPGQWWMSLGYSVLAYSHYSVSGFAILRGEYLSEDRLMGSVGENYRYQFENLPVPSHSVRDPRHVLFLDLLEIAEMENLEQVVTTAVRSEANPLKLNGPPGSHDAAWSGYATVLPEKGKFRCWYTGSSDEFERKWNTCYAESENGIDWIKPELGLVEYKGSKKNNLLFPPEYCTGSALIFRDESDPDPSRRFKLIFDTQHHGGPEFNLSHSADGIHWQLPPQRLWGRPPGPNQVKHGFNPWVEALLSLFRDPLARHPGYRWKLYGQDRWAAYPHGANPKTRNLSLAHGPSPTELMGYKGNPVMDPRTGCNEDQIHGGLVQPYEGVYLCLYQHWEGKEWEVDLRLAVSRDGIHFSRIQPNVPLLPRGPRGSWDSGMLCTPNSLFAHERKIWLYYRGSIGTLTTGRIALNATDSPAARKKETWRMLTGLAHLRQDGFAFLTLKKPQMHSQPLQYFKVPKFRMPMRGILKTIPISADGIENKALHLNVENFAPGYAYVKAQFRDADTGETIKGFYLADCDAVDAASHDWTVSWNGASDLSAITSKNIQLEFELFGALDSPQIYSFWFDDI